MSETVTPPGDDPTVAALVELIRSGNRPEVLAAQNRLLERLTTTGSVFPSRIPPPANITEIGGYLNLLGGAGEQAMRLQAAAAALGIAGPALPNPAGIGAGTVDVPNDRPDGPAQPSIPVTVPVRADLHASLLAALTRIRQQGAALPLRGEQPALPVPVPGGSVPTADALLRMIGRTLEVMPGTALADPGTDAVAIARPDTSEAFQLVARELDGGTLVAEQDWEATQCSEAACTILPAAPARYLAIAPIMAAAGWYHPTPEQLPTSRSSGGTLLRFRNVTGLVAGESTLGAELALLFTPVQIARSAVAGLLDATWDGTAFVAGP
jgi:hypothetical protein